MQTSSYCPLNSILVNTILTCIEKMINHERPPSDKRKDLYLCIPTTYICICNVRNEMDCYLLLVVFILLSFLLLQNPFKSFKDYHQKFFILHEKPR